MYYRLAQHKKIYCNIFWKWTIEVITKILKMIDKSTAAQMERRKSVK